MRFRIVAGLALAIGLLAAPTTSVVACSCAGLGGPVEMAANSAANASVAFVGTVVGVRDAGVDPNLGLPLVRYAFAVERATVPVAEVVEVRAVDDGGGASCGFTFGLEERWFVAADEQGGALHTNLCSGNMLMEGLAAGDRKGVAALVTVEPTQGPETAATDVGWIAWAGVGLAVLGVGAVTVFAFRRSKVS